MEQDRSLTEGFDASETSVASSFFDELEIGVIPFSAQEEIDKEEPGTPQGSHEGSTPENSGATLSRPEEDPQEEWMTNSALSKELGIAFAAVKRVAETFRDDKPEWYEERTGSKTGRQHEHYSPELVNKVRNIISEREPAPEGWLVCYGLSQELGIAKQTLSLLAEKMRKEHPEWFKEYKNTQGILHEHFHPELVSILSNEVRSHAVAPDQWTTNKGLARSHGRNQETVSNIADAYRDNNPEWFKVMRGKGGQLAENYHPELVKIIQQELAKTGKASEGWKNATTLSRDLGVSWGLIVKLAKEHTEDHPEWFKELRAARGGRSLEHYHPELVDLIISGLNRIETAPEGWFTNNALAKELGVSFQAVRAMADRFIEEHPEWVQVFKGTSKGGSKLTSHYHPDLVEAMTDQINQYKPVPPEWATVGGIKAGFNVHYRTVNGIANSFRDDHPEWFSLFKSPNGVVYEYLHPELVETITGMIEGSNKERILEKEERVLREELLEQFEESLSDLKGGKGIKAEEFSQLTKLFGGESSVDILYQLHPEYKKLPLPYVKSRLGEYLGDYLILKGDFSTEDLKRNVELLSNPVLSERLFEVVKNDVLHFYTTFKKNFPQANDRQIIEGYLYNLHEEMKGFEHEAVHGVMADVEAYYSSLFDDIHKPENLVDEIAQNRLFPDVNQRINILKLATQNRLLIADEMGLGKSASAILSKEVLGVKQALIVVPSNVIDTWKAYLSDARGEDGKVIGYFREGQAPNVLVIEDPSDLKAINTADYDYIIISQERLTKRYMTALENLEFDMLIVDEAHKLKNLNSGRRVENLVQLAARINGHPDRYLALLSGTPVPNKVSDIAMTLRLLYPHKFEDVSNRDLTSQILEGDVLELRSLLVPKMEMKSLAESTNMPELNEVVHEIKLSKDEQLVYEILLEEDELTAPQKLQILRQFILNPEMFDTTPILGHSRAEAVGEALQKTYATQDKVVMFFNGYIEDVIRSDVGKTVFEKFNLPNDVDLYIVDGSTSKEERLAIQNHVNNGGGKMLVAISGQTADVGVDFSGADEVYFYNEPWTLYDKKQQLARVYRPGQKHDLVSRTFYATGTIEEGIHRYIETKYKAIEKLLRGIPTSEIERNLLKKEDRADSGLEVNQELAEYYFSSWDRMMKMYGHVKELGEEDFKTFLTHHGQEYAESYNDLGSRSYQANAARLSGTVIDNLAKARRQAGETLRILDVASGPEMLKRHIGDEYQDGVISVDINPHHFDRVDEKRRIGSFLDLPVESGSMDYANLSLALHYTKLQANKRNYERVKVFQELNRVLKKDGVAIVNLMYTLDLKDMGAFNQAMQKTGFKVLNGYSGEASSGNNFRSRMIVLQKFTDCQQDTDELVQSLGRQLIRGFKFSKATDIKLRDSRKIATSFVLGGKVKLQASLNSTDKQVQDEEGEALKQIAMLKRRYGMIKAIPKEEIISRGLARVFNGKTYVLFKKLQKAPGAIIGR